ncbi:MAG: exodeoxyribonuclease VII small subunit [Bacteroidetes bacterium]|nr:exodeoxyribonuclease VII small subunit [Bacteroidota bacterium]
MTSPAPNRPLAGAFARNAPIPMPDADAALPFEALMARLDALTTRLEDPALGLDEALALYEEGSALARQSLERLRDAEARVQTLSLE